MGWPEDWQARVAGTACGFCAEGRPQESEVGLRIHDLHTHVTARYWDDPAPGGPLPDGPNAEVPPEQLASDAAALRLLLR